MNQERFAQFFAVVVMSKEDEILSVKQFYSKIKIYINSIQLCHLKE